MTGRLRDWALLFAVTAALLAVAAVAGSGFGGPEEAPPLPDVEPLVRALAPSIVTVDTGNMQDGQSGGSGVVWSEDGLVLTAAHVIEDARRVVVRDAAGVASRATVVAADGRIDLALLRIPRTDLVPALFAEDLPRAGTLAVTVGRPTGLRWEAGRIEHLLAPAMRPLGSDSLVWSSSDVRGGDSGGALAGEGPVVYGIVVAGDWENVLSADYDWPADSTGAVAMPVVRDFVEHALRGNGDARSPGFLGVDAANVTPRLRQLHDLEASSGVVIMAVQPGTPADRAGLRYGDVIVSVDDAPIRALSELDAVLLRRPADSQISIDYLRDGDMHTTAATLAGRPPDDF